MNLIYILTFTLSCLSAVGCAGSGGGGASSSVDPSSPAITTPSDPSSPSDPTQTDPPSVPANPQYYAGEQFQQTVYQMGLTGQTDNRVGYCTFVGQTPECWDNGNTASGPHSVVTFWGVFSCSNGVTPFTVQSCPVNDINDAVLEPTKWDASVFKNTYGYTYVDVTTRGTAVYYTCTVASSLETAECLGFGGSGYHFTLDLNP